MPSYELIFLRNEIILNNRRRILEFGSGLSTIYIGSVLKKHKPEAVMVSVENDETWYNKIKEMIGNLWLTRFVKLIHAPLIADKNFGGDNRWYESAILDQNLIKIEPFDMVIVDGPPAHSPAIKLSRYGAGPYSKKLLADNHAIFLDDANRSGEKEVLESWREIFTPPFSITITG